MICRCPEELMLWDAKFAVCQVEIVRGSRLQRIYFLVPKVPGVKTFLKHVETHPFLAEFIIY